MSQKLLSSHNIHPQEISLQVGILMGIPTLVQEGKLQSDSRIKSPVEESGIGGARL